MVHTEGVINVLNPEILPRNKVGEIHIEVLCMLSKWTAVREDLLEQKFFIRRLFCLPSTTSSKTCVKLPGLDYDNL